MNYVWITIKLTYVLLFHRRPAPPAHCNTNCAVYTASQFCSQGENMTQNIGEVAAKLRILAIEYRDRLQELDIPIEPKAINPKKTIATCTLPELVAHVLHLFEQFDAIDVAVHPRKARNHLRCIGACVECMQ